MIALLKIYFIAKNTKKKRAINGGGRNIVTSLKEWSKSEIKGMIRFL